MLHVSCTWHVPRRTRCRHTITRRRRFRDVLMKSVNRDDVRNFKRATRYAGTRERRPYYHNNNNTTSPVRLGTLRIRRTCAESVECCNSVLQNAIAVRVGSTRSSKWARRDGVDVCAVGAIFRSSARRRARSLGTARYPCNGMRSRS